MLIIQIAWLYQSNLKRFFADLVRQHRTSSIMDFSKLFCRYPKSDPYDCSWEAGQASDFTGRSTLDCFYWLCGANPKLRMKSSSMIEGFSPLLPPKASVHYFPAPLFQVPKISESRLIAYQTATAFRHGKPCSKRDERGQFKPARDHINR